MTIKPIKQLSKEQLAKISSGKHWSFHGGIHPQENKQQSNQTMIKDAGIPPFLVIAIEYKGYIPELLVKVGDPVLKGQPLTKVYGAMVAQHATSSGVVSAIEKRTDLHPSGLPVLSVVIETDGLDKSIAYKALGNYKKQTNATLIEAIQNAGIVGLGGAGFPSHLKLAHSEGIKLLIINAVECEPYITADDRLMQEHSREILTGINILQHILKPELTVIAIEDNKQEAIAALTQALHKKQQAKVLVRIIPTRYPSGSEKQLIEIITGQQTPEGKYPTDLGIVMHNVGTVFAIKEAIIDGKPLLSRIVTMTGDSLQKKGNARVRIGTPIQYLLNKYRLIHTPSQKLIIGGPLMGFTLSHSDVPVTKICNCILAPSPQEMPTAPPENPCIRCTECAQVCPVQLLPQQLLWYAKSKEYQKLEQYNLSSCIECGACAFVCPSHIPLVEYYRVAKAEINNAEEQARKSETARIRFENRQARLEQAKLERKARHKEAAIKRQQQLKEQNGGEDLIAAALARAKAKKAAAAEHTEESKPGSSKNTAVAAAVARAKAKKATVTESLAKETTAQTEPDNKAAIAARTARKEEARLRKKQQKNDPPQINGDDKQARIAAAIAKAKAKKSAQEEQ
ncbi:MAG: electron transport complex subunit RsxC [Psychromonas sp.]|nr:electron transport complex subunit RsxC [Psychromonas sp.]